MADALNRSHPLCPTLRFYPLDEPADSTSFAELVSGDDAVAGGSGLVAGVPGRLGSDRALSFPGSGGGGGYAKGADSSAWTMGAWSIVGWLRTTAPGGDAGNADSRLISAQGSGQVWGIALKDGGLATISSQDNLVFTEGGAAINDGVWRQFAIVRDPANSTLRVRIDADPARGFARDITATASATLSFTSPLYLGCWVPTAECLLGDLQLVGLWDRALSDADLASLYSDPTQFYQGGSPPPLLLLNDPSMCGGLSALGL